MPEPISTEEHKRFTVLATNYVRTLDRETRNAEAFAVHFQEPPTRTETGTSFSLNFPFLIMTAYFGNQQAIAQRVADILNKHWDDE